MTALSVHIEFLSVMTPCSIADGYQRFGGTLNLKMEAAYSSEMLPIYLFVVYLTANGKIK
jgi:hypothetical protein